MASVPDRSEAGFARDQGFFIKFSVALAIFVAFAFAQFAARGLSHPMEAPVWVHLHGLLMLFWLGLLVMQNISAANGSMALHRALGWSATFVVSAIVGVGCFAGAMAIARHTVPPFFTDAYFLALTQIEAVVFGGMVYAAVLRRGDTQWHRRMMLGATLLVTEPAFGRLLPMPFMPGWGEWVTLACQLALVGILARHDRRSLGAVHPATTAAAGCIALTHVLVELAARTPWVVETAARFAA